VIIPPSILMIVWGGVLTVSIGALYLAGILPGLLIAAAQMATVHVYAKIYNYPVYPRATLREFCCSAAQSVPALMTPFIIVGGILLGWFTATESACVGRAHHSLSPRSGCPMQHRSTRKMPAAADQRDALLQLESFALPELDAAIRLPHPFGVIGVEINRHVPERLTPIDKRRVEVRMRNRDGAQSAKPIDDSNGGVINQRDAIPQDVTFRRAQQQRTLADGKLRRRADADQARFVLAESIVVRNPQPLQRCPRLPLGRDELALVFAHRAVGRGSISGRILGAAG